MPKEVRRGEVEYGGKGGFDKIARTEMARIKAGMTGDRPEEVTPFEKAAQEIIRRQEDGRRRRPWSGGRSGDDGMPLVSFHQMPLKRKPGQGEEDEEGFPWKAAPMPGAEDRPKRVKMNGAMISYIALNLKTREWAKAMGTLKSQRRKLEESFEREAERWAARRLVSAARGNPKGTIEPATPHPSGTP